MSERQREYQCQSAAHGHPSQENIPIQLLMMDYARSGGGRRERLKQILWCSASPSSGGSPAPIEAAITDPVKGNALPCDLL